MNASVFVPARGCRLPFILSALAMAIAAPAFAAEPADVELAPGVVTAVQQSSPLTVIADPKDARQPVPASDATDYLKTIPGFSAIRSGGTNGDPVLRGMFGSRSNLRTNGGLMLGACPGRMDAPSASRSASASSARACMPACSPAPTAASTRCWTLPRGASRATCVSPATRRSPMITRMATAIPCRRAGRSGTATWPSAGHRMPTRCSNSVPARVMARRATPGAAWTVRSSPARASACVSRRATWAACWIRSRRRSTTTTPTTSWTTSACAIPTRAA